jgi:hypothetical protein
MIARMTLRTCAAALAVALALPASAAEVQGVRVPDAVTVDGTQLRHVGSGLRKKFVIKVYVGSLYLAQPRTSAEQVLSADEPWSVRLVFLRNVTRGQMMDAFREGFANNSPDQAAKLAPKLEEIAKALPAEMKERSLLSFAYVPSAGTTVTAQGGKQVTLEGKDLADALLRNWLGPKPADGDLKKAMLGG